MKMLETKKSDKEKRERRYHRAVNKIGFILEDETDGFDMEEKIYICERAIRALHRQAMKEKEDRKNNLRLV